MKLSIVVLVVAVVAILGIVGFLALPMSVPTLELPMSVPTLETVSITAADYSFAAPDSISGGLARFTLANNGKEEHHAQLIRLNEGVTFESFVSAAQAAIKALPEKGEVAFLPILAMGTLEGGPASITPGGMTDAVMNLKAGQYILVCFLTGADGIPHAGKGMVRPLSVTAPTAQQPAAPESKEKISLVDYAFAETPDLKAGKTLVQVINNGKEPHEAAIIRLKGITAEQLQKILSTPPPPAGQAPPPGPPPFESAGGMQAISPGERAWTTVDLKSGDYVYLCFVPSAKDGKPHVQLGMFKPFTVP